MAGVHFEIHVNDGTRARAFYGKLFGWTFTPVEGFEEVDYHLVEGDGIGVGHGVTGAMMQRMDKSAAPGSPIRGAVLTIEVADVDSSYAWALANGGAEALPPDDYPGIGRAANVEDGEGNVVGMITSLKEG